MASFAAAAFDASTGGAGTTASLRAAAAAVHVAGESAGAAGTGSAGEGEDFSETAVAGDVSTVVVAIVAASGVAAFSAGAALDGVVSPGSRASSGLPAAVLALVASEPPRVEREPRCDRPVIVTVPAGLAVVTCVGDDADGVPESSGVAAELVGFEIVESGDDFADSWSDDGESDDGESDDELDCPVASAEATPHPNHTAAPIPKAAAKPPIRPTYADAPMRRLNPDRDHCQ